MNLNDQFAEIDANKLLQAESSAIPVADLTGLRLCVVLIILRSSDGLNCSYLKWRQCAIAHCLSSPYFKTKQNYRRDQLKARFNGNSSMLQ